MLQQQHCTAKQLESLIMHQSNMSASCLVTSKLTGAATLQQANLHLQKPGSALSMAYARRAHDISATCKPVVSQVNHLRSATYFVPCRPAELRHGMVAALSKMAQGQAQAIIAHRAQVKNTTPSVLASLYCGATGMSSFPSFVLPGVVRPVLMKQ